MDELFEKPARELDVEARKKMVKEMIAMVLEDNPNVGLAWFIMSVGHSSSVRNLRMASCHIFVNNRQQEVWLAR